MRKLCACWNQLWQLLRDGAFRDLCMKLSHLRQCFQKKSISSDISRLFRHRFFVAVAFTFSKHLGPDGVFWRSISAFTTLYCFQMARCWISLKNVACSLILSAPNVKRKGGNDLNSNGNITANLFLERGISLQMLRSFSGGEDINFLPYI